MSKPKQKRTIGTIDPLRPSVALLAKLGSIVIHADEGRLSVGHPFDWSAVDALMGDPEVEAWMAAMRLLSLIPVRRT